MKKSAFIAATVGFLVAGSAALMASSVTLDLSGIASGLPARASDVSNAFKALQGSVNDNDARITQNTSAIAALQGASTCPADMVAVGPVCVDIYEASVTDQAGTGLNATACSANGNDCKGVIFARSVAGVAPATGFTWFQAQQACANVGKRLLTNAEWQMAAAGTPDDGATCNTTSGSVANTGTAGCISSHGVFDMVGNANEWVADWIHGANGSTFNAGPGFPNRNTSNNTYGEDAIAANPARTQGTGQNLPGAILRGGTAVDGTGAGVFYFLADIAPSATDALTGFRCAR